MMGKMMGKGGSEMEKAKEHYDALMAILDGMEMSLAEFEEKMKGAEPEGEDEEGEMESEDEAYPAEEPMKPKMDKAKVALIVARMKGKEK